MAKPSGSSQSLGREAEEAACQYLTAQHLKILERNYRTRQGEIDIIAQEDDCIVFIEVRYRSSTDFGTSLETVDERKLLKINRAAMHYLHTKKGYDRMMYRFDVIGFDHNLSSPQWIKNITF